MGIIFTGGAIKAPTIQVSFIPAVMMFCLGGMKPGFIWTFIVIITQFSLVGLSLAGVTFPQVLDSSEMEYNMILDWFIALSAIIATIVIYEYLNLRLKWERDKEHEKYVFMARHDPLTELPNRFMFAYTLERAFGRANRANKKVALFFLDLDDFKPVNDNFGHEIGDIVLVNIAKRLQASIRKTDTAARIGGDEFAVILEGITDSESIERVADKILSEIALPIKVDGHIINLTGSIGAAFYPDHAQDIDTIRKFADLTMYRAKKEQNTWFIYEAEIPDRPGRS